MGSGREQRQAVPHSILKSAQPQVSYCSHRHSIFCSLSAYTNHNTTNPCDHHPAMRGIRLALL